MLEFYNGIAFMLHKTVEDGVRRDGSSTERSVLVSDLSNPARRQTLSQVFPQYGKNQDRIFTFT